MPLDFQVPKWVTALAGIALKSPTDKTGKNRIGKDTVIIDKIVAEFADNAKKTMKMWTSGMLMTRHPDTPRWYMLQDIFEHLSIDPHYKSQAGILKGTILGNRFYIKGPDGKEDKEKTAFLKKKWFYNLVSHLIDSVIKGYTAVQLTDTEKMTFTLIPRRNIVPQKDFVLFKVSEETGVSLRDPAFANSIIYIKQEEEPMGILNDLIPQLIYKRHAEAAWAQFTERFGQPIPVAKTNKSDKKELDRLENMLKKLGQSMSAVLPEGTTFELIAPSGQSDPYNVFDKRIERANSEISKRILGGTMISDQGSSRSQSEVHERIMDDKISERYRRMIEFEVNEQLIPLLNFWGKGFELTDEFCFDRTQQLSLKEQADIIEIFSKIYEIPADWVSETFNIPITGVKQTASPVSDPANFKKAASGKALTLAAKGILLPTYNATSCCKHHSVYMAGQPHEAILKALTDVILKYVWDGKDTLALQIEKALITGSLFRDALFESWGERRMSLTYDAVDHKALASMEYNLFHFSCAREKAGVFAMNEMLLNKEKNGIKTFNDFVKSIEPLTDSINKNWLQAEYNFSVAVGQNASRYQQFITDMQDVTDVVQYQTVGDKRVRTAHAALDGRLFSLKDTEARNLWPPNDWGCRCEMIQYLDDAKGKITTGAEGVQLLKWTDEDKKKFGVNRGDIGQVFLQNQFYITDNGFADDVKAMKYSDYELQPLADLTGYKNLKLDKSITADNVKELFVKEKGTDYMGFKDYLNRQLILKEKVFTEHTADKYIKEDRHRIFPHIKDVIDSPDEVYLTEWKDGKFQTNYIKHYDGKSLLVNGTLGKNNVEINTWYEVKTDKVRSGLLIKGNKKP